MAMNENVVLGINPEGIKVPFGHAFEFWSSFGIADDPKITHQAV